MPRLRLSNPTPHALKARSVEHRNLAPLAFFTVSPVGFITSFNPQAARLLGIAPAQMREQALARFIRPSDQHQYALFRTQLQLQQQDHAQTCLLQMVTADGAAFCAQLEGHVEALGSKERRLHIAVMDLTPQQSNAQELAIAATTFEGNTGLLVTDARRVILRANHAFSRITGFAAQDVLGQTPAFLRSERHDDAFHQAIWSQVAAQGSWSGEIWNRHANGAVQLDQLDIFAVCDSSGSTTHYVASLQDVSEKAALRAATAAWQERFATLFDETLSGLLLADDQGRFLDANPAACRMLGYTREELLGMGDADTTVRAPDGRLPNPWPGRSGARRRSGRVKLRHRDGHAVVADYAAVANLQPGVQLRVMTEVTTQLAAEAALAEAQQRVRTFSLKQQEEFDLLRGNVARDLHDQLGQSLSALKLDVDMLAQTAPHVAQRMYALIKESVSTVREVSRTLRPVTLDLGLGSALQSMAREWSLRSDVDIKADVGPSIPALGMQSELSLYRIAQEALTNATNHSGASRIGLSLEFANEVLTLEVRDDGCGFAMPEPSDQEGLGLIGMRERASLLGAGIQIESAPGQGTLVRVCLVASAGKAKP